MSGTPIFIDSVGTQREGLTNTSNNFMNAWNNKKFFLNMYK